MEHEELHPEDDAELLRGQLAERDAALTAALESSRAAASRLREALLATEPAIDPDLVSGESAADVEASFAAARALLERVRENVRKEQAAHVPAGAPGRSNGTSAMTAFEKIRAGLAGHG